MAFPLLPVLKLIALGSIKIIVLGIGAVLVPVLTVRMVVGGTGESVRLATQWMVKHGQMAQEDADSFLATLTRVQEAKYTRAQARGLLFAKIRKTTYGTVNGFKRLGSWIAGFIKR